jgi:hypothetical protein
LEKERKGTVVVSACVYFAYADTYFAVQSAVAACDTERIAGVELAVARLPPIERVAASLAMDDVQRSRPMRTRAELGALDEEMCSCEVAARKIPQEKAGTARARRKKLAFTK